MNEIFESTFKDKAQDSGGASYGQQPTHYGKTPTEHEGGISTVTHSDLPGAPMGLPPDDSMFTDKFKDDTRMEYSSPETPSKGSVSIDSQFKTNI